MSIIGDHLRDDNNQGMHDANSQVFKLLPQDLVELEGYCNRQLALLSMDYTRLCELCGLGSCLLYTPLGEPLCKKS